MPKQSVFALSARFFVEAIRAMATAAFTAVTAFKVVLCGEHLIAFL